MPKPAKLGKMLLERPAVRRSCRLLVVMTLGAALVGCSSAGDTTRKVVKNLNPVNWFGEDEDDKEKKPLQTAKGSTARKSYPRLGDVPSRPKKPTPEEQTQEIAEGLAADTQNAKYSDQQLRQSAAVFGGRGQPQRTIQRSQPVPVARPAVRAPTPRVSRSVAPPVVRPPTASSPSTVRAPQPVRPPSPTTQSRAVKPPSSTRISAPPPPVAPPPLVRRPNAASTAKPTAPPRPLAAPPAPRAARITPPPPVTASSAPADSRVQAPVAARPTLAPPPPPKVTPRAAQAPAVRAPTVARAPAPTAAQSARAPTRAFATPVGRPSTKAKPPPTPQPLRGPAGAQTVAVAPPRPVQLSRAEPTNSPQATVPKSVQVGTIYFGDGSARLSGEDVSIIAAVTQAFGQTGGKIRVVGHSSMGANTLSPTRREEINFKMSLRRANAVANELIRHGVPRENVEVIAEGDRAPAYEESSQTGAAYNRRAEIFIDYRERS